MDIVINGEEHEKAKIAFNLIDTDRDGIFNKKDLSEMIFGIIGAWSGISGYAISKLLDIRYLQSIEYINTYR